MSRIIVLCGLPASGKSHYAARFGGGQIVKLSSDEIREKVFGDVSSQKYNGYVFSIMRMTAEKVLSAGCDVLIDSTNILARYRKPWIDIGRRLGVPVVCIFINPDLKECLRRNSQRERRVPDDIIEKMYCQLEPPDLREGFNEIIVY